VDAKSGDSAVVCRWRRRGCRGSLACGGRCAVAWRSDVGWRIGPAGLRRGSGFCCCCSKAPTVGGRGAHFH